MVKQMIGMIGEFVIFDNNPMTSQLIYNKLHQNTIYDYPYGPSLWQSEYLQRIDPSSKVLKDKNTIIAGRDTL